MRAAEYQLPRFGGAQSWYVFCLLKWQVKRIDSISALVKMMQ